MYIFIYIYIYRHFLAHYHQLYHCISSRWPFHSLHFIINMSKHKRTNNKILIIERSKIIVISIIWNNYIY